MRKIDRAMKQLEKLQNLLKEASRPDGAVSRELGKKVYKKYFELLEKEASEAEMKEQIWKVVKGYLRNELGVDEFIKSILKQRKARKEKKKDQGENSNNA
jgi:hypothetical protein